MIGGLLLWKLWDLSEIFPDLRSICCHRSLLSLCELPASRHFSALGATAYSLYSCAQLSKAILHGRFFPPYLFLLLLLRGCFTCLFHRNYFFSFIQITSEQRQDLLSWSQTRLWVFLAGLSPCLSQTAAPDLAITGTKAGPGCLDPSARETPVSTSCSLLSCSK